MTRVSAMGPCLAVAIALTLLAARTAGAAGSEDWPCVQRKVPEISLAAVWAGPPLDEAALKWRTDPGIAGLVERLAARRTSEDEARQAIAGLVASSGEAKGPRAAGAYRVDDRVHDLAPAPHHRAALSALRRHPHSNQPTFLVRQITLLTQLTAAILPPVVGGPRGSVLAALSSRESLLRRFPRRRVVARNRAASNSTVAILSRLPIAWRRELRSRPSRQAKGNHRAQDQALSAGP